jgi:hypothetical protein
MSHERHNFSVAVLGDKIFAIGGLYDYPCRNVV